METAEKVKTNKEIFIENQNTLNNRLLEVIQAQKNWRNTFLEKLSKLDTVTEKLTISQELARCLARVILSKNEIDLSGQFDFYSPNEKGRRNFTRLFVVLATKDDHSAEFEVRFGYVWGGRGSLDDGETVVFRIDFPDFIGILDNSESEIKYSVKGHFTEDTRDGGPNSMGYEVFEIPFEEHPEQEVETIRKFIQYLKRKTS